MSPLTLTATVLPGLFTSLIKLHKLRKPIFALLIVPLVYVGLVIFQVHKLQPLYFGVDTFDYDAAYSYLISSISLTIGDVPHFADHPGTLNHILLAFALRCYQAFMVATGASSKFCTTTSCVALDHSEAVLNLAGNFTLALSSLSVFFWGWSLYKSSLASIWICFLSQAVFLSVPNLLPFFKVINGETTGVPLLLIGASISLLTNSLASSRNSPAKNKNTLLITGGCLSGIYFSLMMLSKLSFLPAVLLLALNFSHIAFLSGLISLSAGFFLWGMKFTDWSRFKQYWLLISTHTGSYGGGAKGLVDVQQAIEGAGSVVSQYPFIPIVIILLLAALLVSLRVTPKPLVRISLLRSGIRLASVSIVAYGLAFGKSNFQIILYLCSSLLILYLASLLGLFRYAILDSFEFNAFSKPDRGQAIRLLNSEHRVEDLFVLCACQVLSVMAVVKHFDERYLLASVAITAISLGLALGFFESCSNQTIKPQYLTQKKLSLTALVMFAFIAVQGLKFQMMLVQKINERNSFMSYDQLIISRARLAHPNAEFIGEYRIKGFPEFAKAFGFIMATSQKKTEHIMSFYSNPEKQLWIWKSGHQKIWSNRGGEFNAFEFNNETRNLGDKKEFIFAVPDNTPLPSLQLVKIAELRQKAGLFLHKRE